MSLQGRVVLVTGATGFLGGALAARLAAEGAQVRALARRPERGASLHGISSIQIVQGDITDVSQLREPFENCDYVFHVAASTGGPIEKQRRNNVLGARNVAEAAAQAEVKRLIHVSTIAVYGYRQQGDVTEATAHNPGDDPYNITKSEAERVVREVAAGQHLPFSIIRPGMIYGPRSKMWTKTLFNLAKRRPTPWLGNGNGSTFPIFIDDVLNMMMVLATHPSAVGEAFHCTPDPSPTWRDFLGAYARLAGHQRWLSIPPFPARVFAAMVSRFAKPETQTKALSDVVYMSQQRITFKMIKARELLGWTARVDLESGVHTCASWLREQGLLD
jgi:nucleoside-diphosphate-sugar epimerase